MSNFEGAEQEVVDTSVEVTPDVEEVVEETATVEAVEEQSTPAEPQAYEPYPVDGRPV